MGYVIRYSCISDMGLMRGHNEDNYYLNGSFMPQENLGSDLLAGTVPVKKKPVFAVMDGMGGLADGEVASYLAAKDLKRACGKMPFLWTKRSRNQFCVDNCRQMNQAVTDYAKSEQIKDMGSTVVMAMFTRRYVTFANVGDSAAFCMQDGVMKKMSYDHVLDSPFAWKPPLVQYIGMDVTKTVLVPYVQEVLLKPGMQILICTDGVTDMLPQDKIQKILAANRTVTEKVARIRDQVMKRGARDNLTLILAEVVEVEEKGIIHKLHFPKHKK